MNLQFERKNGLNCFEYLIKSIAEYYSLGYELMFLESWGFNFIYKNPINYNKCIFPENTNSIKLLEKFHGIKINTYFFEKYDEYIKFIDNYLENKNFPILFVDLFCVPWSLNNFGLHNIRHAILIIKKVENGYMCYDFFSLEPQLMPFDMLKKCFGEVRLIKIVKLTNNINDEKVSNELYKDLKVCLYEKFIINNSFEKMKNFSDLIQNDFELNDVSIGHTNLANSYFMNAINRLAMCRFQFGISLEYIYKIKNIKEFIIFSKEIEHCAIMWKTVWGMLMKASFMSKNDKLINKVSLRILEISDKERKLFETLYNFLGKVNKFNINIQIDKEKIINKKYYKIDLMEYFNHKAFGSLDNNLGANFREGFILINDDINKNFIKHNEFEFKIPNLEENTFDNIMCNNQTILINRKCKGIMILSCSEFSHQREIAKIISKNSEFGIEILCTCWKDSTPIFGDEIIWSGKEGILGKTGLVESIDNRYLFAKSYNFKYEKYIEKIILPYCPDFHIFAITLCV